MADFLRLRTSYACGELLFPECFERVECRLEKAGFGWENLCSEYVNVARRMADIDLFAWHIATISNPSDPARACPLVSSYLVAYFGACKALFDAAALFLTALHNLQLAPKEQDFRKGKFWTALKGRSPTAHDRYEVFKNLCNEVIRWRDAAVHRAAPLAMLHLTTEQCDQWRPEEGSIRVIDDPDWRGSGIGAETGWLHPLDKHNEWRPRFIELSELISEDQLEAM